MLIISICKVTIIFPYTQENHPKQSDFLVFFSTFSHFLVEMDLQEEMRTRIWLAAYFSYPTNWKFAGIPKLKKHLTNRSKRTFFFNVPIYISNILRFYAYLPKKHFAISNLISNEISHIAASILLSQIAFG